MAHPRTPFWDLDADLARKFSSPAGKPDLQLLLDLIARFSLWVDPGIARAVPVVYPKTARIAFGRAEQGTVQGAIRYWTNQPAESAFFEALGTTELHFSGLTVCHVYPGSAGDPRHFTRLANLVVVPRTLAAFTEWGPVLEALKWRAFELYGYQGPRRQTPAEPPTAPNRWMSPTKLTTDARLKILVRLRHLRRTRPMYSTPGGPGPPQWRPKPALWQALSDLPRGRLEVEALPHAQARPTLAKDARDLDQEFWTFVHGHPRMRKALVGWVVHHAFMAPPPVVAAVPNPFPRTRRARAWSDERIGQVVDGIAVGNNEPARTALLVAIGATIRKTRGGLVDHPWPESAYIPAHNAHLGGLVLVPRALGSLIDAPPVRAMLQRRLFDRTGYAGPHRPAPKPSPLQPGKWPETVTQDAAAQARAIATLRRYLETRPQYYRPWKPGGPGRPPKNKG